MKSLFAILTSLFLTLPSYAAYQIGDVVDNFIIDDTDGISRSLYDYKGKIIVLNFGEWWCGPCNSEWAAMPEGLWQPNKDQGVVIFTIGSDDETQFNLKEQQFNDGWLWTFDTGGQLYWDYGNGYIPYNAILDQDFRLIWGDAGFGGSFAAIQNQIDMNLYDVAVHQLSPQYVTASPGDNVAIDVTLTNLNTRQSRVNAVVDIILPGHSLYPQNPMLSQTVAIPGNMTGQGTVSMNIPLMAPPGVYGIRVGVGSDEITLGCSDLTVLTIQ